MVTAGVSLSFFWRAASCRLFLLLLDLKLVLAHAADGADEILGQILKGGAGGNP